MDRRIYFVLPIIILLIVAVSGCTTLDKLFNKKKPEGDYKTAQNTALTVVQFSPEPSTAKSNQAVQLHLAVKSTGGETARKVKAKLYNVPFSGESGWTSASGSLELWKELGDLKPPDKENKIPGEIGYADWNLRAPELHEGFDYTYEFAVRLHYLYKTLGMTQIQVMTSEEFSKEGLSRSTPTARNTAAPIKIEVRTPQPVIIYPDDNEFRFCIIVRNMGVGTPFLAESESDYLRLYSPDTELENKIKVKVDFGSLKSRESEKEVSLISGEGQTCFDVSVTESGIDPKVTIPVSIIAEYGYYIEKSTSVLVKG